ncbi:bleomycin resistance protein [Candidatus Roizmanbacteria bacterium RIFCSPHIGHO2_12_FULL_33_9]|uniref:Bleomycin resistance protein n=1 Tax=Candidatus Roizmanbacteria bacterium RIFCSPHIGHO2_12_FULL_33_9 TaxID=1802045 RepID=A0A1F7HJC9_9BACT|nr:MAG: bleomycin resistance protein [Candidatus Roizmanbacteria bacterium RIFCSPHIGHO2_12_FULL_33_9]
MTLRIELFTSDTKRSIEFYEKVLGFKKILSKPDYDYHNISRDNVHIGITSAQKSIENHYFRPELLTSRKGLGTEIVLEVDDIELIYNQVKKSGHPIHDPLTKRNWGLTDFRIVDPDGYYLRITSR